MGKASAIADTFIGTCNNHAVSILAPSGLPSHRYHLPMWHEWDDRTYPAAFMVNMWLNCNAERIVMRSCFQVNWQKRKVGGRQNSP